MPKFSLSLLICSVCCPKYFKIRISLSLQNQKPISLSVQPRNQFCLLQHSTNPAASPRNGGSESDSLLRIEKERKEEKKKDCRRWTRRPSHRRPCSSTLSLSIVDAVFSYCPPPLLLPSFFEAAALARRRRLSTPSSAAGELIDIHPTTVLNKIGF